MIDTRTLRADLLRVNSEAEAICSKLTADQLNWRPHRDKWSIAENLIHLCATTKVFLPAVTQAIAESRKRNLLDGGPFRLGWYGRLLVWYVEPPPKIRMPAPKALRPELTQTAARGLEDFLALQATMMRRMEDAEGIDLTGLRFPSPLAAYVKMNLLEFFAVFNGHSRRHLWQAANVRRGVE